MKTVYRNTALALVVGLTLAACGGGDSDSTAVDTGGGGTATGVVITDQNMTAVASAATSSMTSSFVAVESGELALGAETTSSERAMNALVKLTMDKLKSYMKVDHAGSVVVGAQFSETVNCVGGGNLQIVANLQDVSADPQLMAGDTMAMTMNNCSQDGNVISGGMQFTFNAINGDFAANGNLIGHLDLSVVYNNLRLANSVASLNFNGDMRIIEDGSATEIVGTMSANSLTYALQSGNQTVTMALSNVSLTNTYNYATDLETDTYRNHFNVTFPTFSGTGDIETVNVLQGLGSQDYPYSGRVKVTGSNSVLYLTFQPGGSVYLELDRDNDGDIDTTQTRLMSELDLVASL